jgi:soluble cytochrome b562
MKSQNSLASTWGNHLVSNMAAGIRGAIDTIRGAASAVADAVRAILHFTRPDEGPLRDYEQWMPHMVAGLAQTLRKAAPKLINEVKGMADQVSTALNSYEIKEPDIPDLNALTRSIAVQKETQVVKTLIAAQQSSQMDTEAFRSLPMEVANAVKDALVSNSESIGNTYSIGNVTYLPDSRIEQAVKTFLDELRRIQNMGVCRG